VQGLLWIPLLLTHGQQHGKEKKHCALDTRAAWRADCGAGVGRVTEQLLLAHCAEVDLVEPSRHLLDAARARLAPSCSGGRGDSGEGELPYPPGHAASGFFEMGLQGFTPAPGR